jgi:hypothetical protein
MCGQTLILFIRLSFSILKVSDKLQFVVVDDKLKLVGHLLTYLVNVFTGMFWQAPCPHNLLSLGI